MTTKQRSGRRRSPWQMLAAQFTDFMILVLIGAALIAGLVGDPQDAIAIVVIVLLNALVGFFQEYRAERAMAALVRMAAPHARAVRDAHVADIAARDLVPGDVVLLETGDIVAADLRLVRAARFKVQESALTGCSKCRSVRCSARAKSGPCSWCSASVPAAARSKSAGATARRRGCRAG